MADTITPERGPRRWLVVMAKEPRCGAVKTRLASDIGAVAATRFYRNTLANVSARLARDPRWRTALAVTPDTSINASLWPRGTVLMPQGTGDLGVRMQWIFDCLPPGPALIVGTDIPEISAKIIAGAFSALQGHDAVFGPAKDGGYWLVGLKRSPRVRRIFDHVRWSGPHALTDTLANLEGARVAMLEQLGDVDDGVSYAQLGHAASRRVLAGVKG